MPRIEVLALILAGGAGGRLDVLTERRAKPAMPFAGVYRLIDFALSNCMHSGISDVWVLEQYEPHRLNDHLANGRPWDLDRTYGGLRVLPPYERRQEEGGGFSRGNADAIHRHRAFIEEADPELLLVLSADHVYKLDYGEVVRRHRAHDADVTVVTTRVPRERAGRFGVVEVEESEEGDGRLTGFEYKPEEPKSDLVTTEVFLYDTRCLLEALERLAADDGELGDFGHELLPSLVAEGRAREHRFDGYWRDVGTVPSYWRTHMELLDPGLAPRLDDPAWPILTYGAQRLPARLEATARLERAFVSPGCLVEGTVVRSVLSPGVVVERGAEVRDSVLLHDAVVRAGARVDHAVLDSGVEIGQRARVGEAKDGGEDVDRATAEEIALVGAGARIAPRDRVRAGARVPPAPEGLG